MHYRHSYHAGNFADVFKHALLCGLLDALSRKPAPWCYVDTHAGAGSYDLGSLGAARTGEWREGIGRLAGLDIANMPPMLAAYLAQVRAYGGPEPSAYPGSPLLAAALARPQDRLLLCERVPEVAADLRQTLGKRATLHVRDGYEAAALLPPAEKRGLVLIDPPFEESREFEAMADFIITTAPRYAGGVYAAWYPIKNPHLAGRFRRRVARESGKLTLDLRLETDAPRDGGMHACGLLVVNPPFGFEAQARILLAFLAPLLARGAHADWQIETVHG